MPLRDNAARLAGLNGAESPAAAAPSVTGPADEPMPELPEVDEPEVDAPVADVPAVVAWNRVMREVRAIAKGDKFNGGRAGNFDFRGIDRVVEHFGPAVRRHGVLVIPHRVDKDYRDIKTSGGGTMRQCDVTITWRIYGPQGDWIEAQTAGEGLDTGGRSTSKAQTVAERVLFLIAGVVPTKDNDPESQNIERGEADQRPAADYRDEALSPRTSFGRMKQMLWELEQAKRLGEIVENETGDDEAIGALIRRIGNERFGGGRR